MSHGVVSVFSVTMTSGALSSTVADLSPRGWRTIFLEVPTMASGSLFILGSTDNSTYRRVMKDNGNTSTVQQTFSINSSITQVFVPVPANGIRYLKVESTSGATDVVTTFKLVCSD